MKWTAQQHRIINHILFTSYKSPLNDLFYDSFRSSELLQTLRLESNRTSVEPCPILANQAMAVCLQTPSEQTPSATVRTMMAASLRCLPIHLRRISTRYPSILKIPQLIPKRVLSLMRIILMKSPTVPIVPLKTSQRKKTPIQFLVYLFMSGTPR